MKISSIIIRLFCFFVWVLERERIWFFFYSRGIVLEAFRLWHGLIAILCLFVCFWKRLYQSLLLVSYRGDWTIWTNLYQRNILDYCISLFVCLFFGRERIVWSSCKLRRVRDWWEGVTLLGVCIFSHLNLSSARKLGFWSLIYDTSLNRTCLFVWNFGDAN